MKVRNDVEADSGGMTEAGTTQRNIVREDVVEIQVSFNVSKRWLQKLKTSIGKKQMRERKNILKRKKRGGDRLKQEGRKNRKEEAFRIGGKALRTVLLQLLAELEIIAKMSTTVFSTVATAIIGSVFGTIKKVWMMLKQGWSSLKNAVKCIKDFANIGKPVGIFLEDIYGNMIEDFVEDSFESVYTSVIDEMEDFAEDFSGEKDANAKDENKEIIIDSESVSVMKAIDLISDELDDLLK